MTTTTAKVLTADDWLRWEQEKHQRLLTTPNALTEVA